MLSGEIESVAGKASWLQKLLMSLTGHEFSGNTQQLQHSLQATTVKLVQVHRQIDRLQSQHNLEMMQLAQAYQALPRNERQQLPESLRKSLDRIESDYA
jgi:DNA-binding NtrC family response regulator